MQTEIEKAAKKAPPIPQTFKKTQVKGNEIKRAMQLFQNDLATFKEVETLLIKNDYRTQDGVNFISPAAVLGSDAKIDKVNKCFVVSRTVFPFDQSVNYSFYQVFLKLAFNGNYQACNKWLIDRYADKLESSSVDLVKLVTQSEINISEDLEPAPVILTINEVPILTNSNFIILTGKAKSRKTFFSMLLIASLISGRKVFNINSSLPEDKKTVLFIDTEQSNYHVQLYCKRVLKLAGSEGFIFDSFRAFALRQHATSQRFEIVRYLVENTPNLGCIVLDGLRDLVTDINSQDQAVAIVDFLMSWTMTKGIGLVTILHQNKSDNNVRGSVGTEAINKSETTISVTKDIKDKSISVVSAEYSRNMDFEDFAFHITSEGLPELCEMPTTGQKKKVVDSTQIEDQKHIEVLRQIFKGSKPLGYSDLWRSIKYQFSILGNTFGDNKAKDYLSHYEARGFLSVTDGGFKGRKSFKLKDELLV